ncbi:hypothetical protein B0H65DRAFT_534607 [Neurospora tetraspora]|uniref:Uncharacterized protein n=1 Tax=Neurospora tetraspora TaxID=94610 RepID=A0AAE0J0D6_9PEZI|nr:hypothetical protein B0H65DRAFT_534607 [Neurospora tetraspora]
MDAFNSRPAAPNLQVPQFEGTPAHRDARSDHTMPNNINEGAIQLADRAPNSAYDTPSIGHSRGRIPSIHRTHSHSTLDDLSCPNKNSTGGSPTLDEWELNLFNRLSQIVHGPGDPGPIGQPSGSLPVLAEGGQDGEVAPVATEPALLEAVVLPKTNSALSRGDPQHPSPQPVARCSEPLELEVHLFSLPYPSLQPRDWDERGYPILNNKAPSQPGLRQTGLPQAALPQPALPEPGYFEEIFAEPDHAEPDHAEPDHAQPTPSDSPHQEQSPADLFADEVLLEPGPTYSEMFPEPSPTEPSLPMAAQVEPSLSMSAHQEHAATASPEYVPAEVTSSELASAEPASAEPSSSERVREPIIIKAKCQFSGCDAKA